MQVFKDPTKLTWTDAAANVDGSTVTEGIAYQIGFDPVAAGQNFPIAVTAFSNVLGAKNVSKDSTGTSVENIADILTPAPGNYVASVREVNVADTSNPIVGDWADAIGITISDTRRPGKPTGFSAA